MLSIITEISFYHWLFIFFPAATPFVCNAQCTPISIIGDFHLEKVLPESPENHRRVYSTCDLEKHTPMKGVFPPLRLRIPDSHSFK